MAEGHEIAMALRRAYLTMHRQADAALAPFELTANQFVLLALLNERDGVSQRDLVDRASSDPYTIRPVLQALEGKGLIRRSPDPTDGRAWMVEITTFGSRTYAHVRLRTEDFRKQLMSGLQNEEADLLLRALEKVALAMTEETTVSGQ